MAKKQKCDSSQKADLLECMHLKKFTLLDVFKIGKNYILGVYEGRLSPNDILIKYRQKERDGKWSRIRTPKHIHWAVDILMKMQKEKELTQRFLRFLLKKWEKVKPIESSSDRLELINVHKYIEENSKEINKFKDLNKAGEYSIEFLIILAELLMLQEKTNKRDAYMFKNLLTALLEGEDIFKIVSIATHRGKGN